jgi:hypothetical protein
MTDLLMDFYRLGTIRKPELMERSWALSMTPERAKELESEYQQMLDHERSVAGTIPAEARDAYAELVGFPARVLGESGQIFSADRKGRLGQDAPANEEKIATLRDDLEAQVGNYNTNLVSGKWNRMMPGLVTGKSLMAWSSQVRWPWGETTNSRPVSVPEMSEQNWRNAAKWDRQSGSGKAQWSAVEGLGTSGNAVALLPVTLSASWAESDATAPALEYDFNSKAGDAEAWIDFLPAFRLYPGMKLRVVVCVDGGTPTIVEVPGSSGAENENGKIRSQAVQDNYVRARVPLAGLTAGKHTFKVRAMDPGAVIDRVHLP